MKLTIENLTDWLVNDILDVAEVTGLPEHIDDPQIVIDPDNYPKLQEEIKKTLKYFGIKIEG